VLGMTFRATEAVGLGVVVTLCFLAGMGLMKVLESGRKERALR
jgi:hypothetical protein